MHPMSEPSNIARHLPSMAARLPDHPAVKIPRGRTSGGQIDYLTLTYRELEAEAEAWRQKLSADGVSRGDRVLVMVRPGLPLIASVFALFALGAVPIVIDPGMGLRAFLRCVRQSKPQVLLGVPLAVWLSRLLRPYFRTVDVRVSALAGLDARLSRPGSRERLEVAATQSDELAAILFTSGSTGAPKGVCYEHGMFEAQVRLVRDAYRIEPGEVDLPLLPVFALFNPALGLTTIVPELDPRRPASMDPSAIVQAILQEGVTNSFGSPTLWRRIGDYCIQNNITLPRLKRVLCAGAPVPASLWRDSSRFLTHGLLHSPYGATEALPVTTVSASDVDLSSFAGAHVGKPLPGVEVRIIEITDRPLPDWADAREVPPGTIGEIIVRGDAVTRCYDDLPEATGSAKIVEPNGRIWHRMGDAGFFDEDGDLWFCGRKAERVQTEEGTLHTEPCERVFRQHHLAGRYALIGLGHPGRQTPAIVAEIAVRDSEEALAHARALRSLAIQHPHTSAIRTFYFRPAFPVDVRHNAKIHRLALARWAQSAKGYRD